jgi:hypothetical protein
MIVFGRRSFRFSIAPMSEILEFHDARGMGRFLQTAETLGENSGCRKTPWITPFDARGMLTI